MLVGGVAQIWTRGCPDLLCLLLDLLAQIWTGGPVAVLLTMEGLCWWRRPAMEGGGCPLPAHGQREDGTAWYWLLGALVVIRGRSRPGGGLGAAMEELLHWTEPRQEERALLRAGLECGGCPSREGAA